MVGSPPSPLQFHFLFCFFFLDHIDESSLSCQWKRALGNTVLILGWALSQSLFRSACVFYQSVTSYVCFFSYRTLCSQWDVRALEAALTAGAWWNTNPSRSMSASCVCHVSLGSTVAAGNAINVPMMTPPRWEREKTPFVSESEML